MNSVVKTLSLSYLSKIQNIVTYISKIKKITIVIKLKNLSHPKKTAKLKTSDNKDLNNPASLNRFKILEDKEIDDKENQHNEHEDSISHSTGQPQDTDRVQSQVIVKKSTFSKPKSPTTTILVDSIVKDVYGNIITKSVKRQKQIVVKHFSAEKIQM